MHDRLAHAQGRRLQLRDHFAVPGEAGEIALAGETGERRHGARRQRSGAAHIDVEARVARGDLNVERLADGTDRFRNRPRRIDGAVQAFGQNRTAVDRHQPMRTRGGKADLEHLMRAPPGVEYRPAAALAVRVDKLGDRRVEARLPQRFDDEIALPGAVARKVPVLHGAAAAYAEMRDRWERRARRLACRRAGGGGDPDARRRSRLRPFHRARRRAHRLGRRRCRRRRHRDARASRSRGAQPRSASMKNSRLPSPPRIGEGATPPTFHPCAARNAAISLHTR